MNNKAEFSEGAKIGFHLGKRLFGEEGINRLFLQVKPFNKFLLYWTRFMVNENQNEGESEQELEGEPVSEESDSDERPI